MAEIEDTACAWFSGGLGPMRWAPVGAMGWNLWRRLGDGSQRFCGHFLIDDEMHDVAKILAQVPDSAFERTA